MPVTLRVAAALIAGLAAACSPTPPPQDYVAEVARVRAEKDQFFRSSPESPILPADRGQFLPLSYFAPDESYAVPASFVPADDPDVLQMPTSTGKIRDMERIGKLEFTLKGERRTLSAFTEAGTERITRLFVPFSDLTSGTETYPAGRYMDIDPTPTGIYVVDFNAAYHPYCYYNPEYDCPFPPPENRLAVPIRAGERLPPAAASLP